MKLSEPRDSLFTSFGFQIQFLMVIGLFRWSTSSYLCFGNLPFQAIDLRSCRMCEREVVLSIPLLYLLKAAGCVGMASMALVIWVISSLLLFIFRFWNLNGHSSISLIFKRTRFLFNVFSPLLAYFNFIGFCSYLYSLISLALLFCF